MAAELPELARLAERAADRAREEILPRFRCVGVETAAGVVGGPDRAFHFPGPKNRAVHQELITQCNK